MASRKDSKGRVLKQGESQRKDGRYSYRYVGLDGKRKEVYASSLNELRQKEKQIFRDSELGIRCEDITLDECFDRYMSTKYNLRETTYCQYVSIYNYHVRGTSLGEKKIKQIHRSDMLLFCKEKLNTLAGTSVKVLLRLLYSVFEFAVEDDYILKNPAKGCSKTLPGSKPKEAIPDNELEKFFEYAESKNLGNDVLPLARFLLGTGLRIGEATGLTWKDVDLNSGAVTVNKQLRYVRGNDGIYKHVITDVKTESGNRIVPLSEEMVALMKSYKESTFFKNKNKGCVIDGYTGFVFLTNCGNPMNATGVDGLMKRIENKYKAETGEDMAHVSCHLLRHTFCTRMAQKGMNPQALQYIMGHADFTLTANVYISEDAFHAEKEFRRVMSGAQF